MDFLKKNPMIAYGLMALLVVLIIVVIYYYYNMSRKDADAGSEAYTAGIPPHKPFPELMTASYIPDSRSDREYMNGSVRDTLHAYGLPATREPYAGRPGAPLPYSTENALYKNLHQAAARAQSLRGMRTMYRTARPPAGSRLRA